MVGRQPLELVIKVRILVPELFRGRLSGRTVVPDTRKAGSNPALGTNKIGEISDLIPSDGELAQW